MRTALRISLEPLSQLSTLSQGLGLCVGRQLVLDGKAESNQQCNVFQDPLTTRQATTLISKLRWGSKTGDAARTARAAATRADSLTSAVSEEMAEARALGHAH